ncbi:tetratricopeptide repeat protein 28-like isoform X2 [Stylophora pistillata]|uniref:tetratricopeptide repeat protein 28-like isoform X2 n=1 Tax=Stylophora pistillata TaxID=50429 RepID=UPI000C03986B|nr:tetratricopeptide repeat protein 28-like isoform X2 [Stylophora pistillata]
MEYLVPEHQGLAKDGLDKLRQKLPSADEDVLKKVKEEETLFPYLFEIAQHFTRTDLPTALIIWEYILEKAMSKQQKFAITNQIFQIQIATGPWKVAFETAKKLYEDTALEYSSDNLRGLAARENAPLLFEAALNLGTIHRLLKELNEAEKLYRRAWNIATFVIDFDRESLAKVHLAICLLDRGELRQAIDTYFRPLMVSKATMKPRTRALYLQYYGNACRSAADWGRAKEYLREALGLVKEMKDVGLVSSCCGDLGNVFRSEGRYKDAEQLFSKHYEYALSRGDIHGLAVACNNIGYLKFYNPNEFNDSVVYQFIAYSLAEQVGDFARMGMAFNKIGKLYTTLGYNDFAVKMFRFAIDRAHRADNVAREGMAWGNLGTVYRALGRFEDAINCHVKYRDNAERRMDIGGVAIMQHQLAMDYILLGKLPEAGSSVLDAFQTLERIRAQVGEEDKSKLSNFEKNQAEAYNLLQVLLVAQGKFKEALVLADASRGRALAEIVRKRLSGCSDTTSREETVTLDEEFITKSFNNLVEVSHKLSTTLVFYSVVKEFDQSGAYFTWVYTWVLGPSGSLHFKKTRLQHGLETKVEVNDEYIVSLRRSLGQQSQKEEVGKILRSCGEQKRVSREAKIHFATLKGEDVLNSLEGFEHEFATGWRNLRIPLKVKDQRIQEHIMVPKEAPKIKEERTSNDSIVSPDSWPVDRLNAEKPTTNKTEPCNVVSPESYEVSSIENALSSGHSKQSNVTKHSVAFDEDDAVSGKSPLVAECQEEDPQDNSKKQSEMEKDKSSFATSEESIQHPLIDSVVSHPCAYLKSDIAKSKISIASKPSGNRIDEEAMTTGPGGSGAPTPGLEHDLTIKLSGEESNSSLQGNNKIEEENSDQFPVKVGGDVSVGTLSGPLNDVVTEVLGADSKVQNNEPQNNPEPDPWIPLLSQLHEILIEPIIHFLPRKEETRRVTFIPQDFLLKVPFAALQSDSRSHYFMEDFIISTSPAVQFLNLACASRETIQQTTAPQELTLLAVGNPIMPFEELPQLPSAEREVRMIKETINSPMSEILIGFQAQKVVVMEAMPKYKILHFATHAIIDDIDSHGDFSMKGLIVLAKSDLECNGILTAEEVMGMELNADLVVLSCCETGLGKVTGDGILGLSRAFLAAGASCVIVTLWKIDDGPASELMMSFYREYKASRDAAVSLQRSMKILQSKEDTRSPQHWAAFSIVGATGLK